MLNANPARLMSMSETPKSPADPPPPAPSAPEEPASDWEDSPLIETEPVPDDEQVTAKHPALPIDWTPEPIGARPAPSRAPVWSWMAVLLFVAGSISVIATQRGIGVAWDEAYYHEPARNAAAWAVELFTGDRPASLTDWIEARWGENHEHPGVSKFIAGFSLHLFEAVFGTLGAVRLPMALLFGATLALIFLLGRRAWGPGAGAAAALCYFAMPRVFGHAHMASLETPLIFFIVLTVYAFVRGLESRVWSIAAGLCFGALLATKINGFFLIPPLLLWGYLYERGRCVHNFFFMATLGPAATIALWPWLWPDPAVRFIEYLGFHATHQQTGLWFLGSKWGYGLGDAPWYYPSVMIGATVPAGGLALMALGTLGTILRVRRWKLSALFLLIGLVMWAVASVPSVPKYDGVRLFLPLFPFLALMGGAGYHVISGGVHAICRRCRLEHWRICRLTGLLGALICLIVAAEGATAIYGYHPYLLSYFNAFTGGLSGAEEAGFETAYWGESVNKDVLAALNDESVIPPGSRLYVFALYDRVFHDMQRWGMLREDLEINGPHREEGYDFHLLQMRRGMFGRPEWALAEPGPESPPGIEAVRVWSKMGVPMVALFRTGEAYERYWTSLPVSYRGSGRSALEGAPRF